MTDQELDTNARARLYHLGKLIIAGAQLDEVLEHIFDSFGDIIPYDRIGFADVDLATRTAHARWAKSHHRVLLQVGYSAKLAGSSLSIVLERRQPRVLNDLKAYLEARPKSHSTHLVVAEGIQSSMTCPLIVNGTPTGFLFFSSRNKNTYTPEHVRTMEEVGQHLAMLIMASQQSPSDSDEEVVVNEPQSAPDICSLSQLKAGMVLDEEIRMTNHSLLAAAGLELSDVIIERLIVLRIRGLIRRSSFRIRLAEIG